MYGKLGLSAVVARQLFPPNCLPDTWRDRVWSDVEIEA